MSHSPIEIELETRETPESHDIGRRIESPDDIVREIADRRLHAEFGEMIPPERSSMLIESPDSFESSEEFDRIARSHGIAHTEGLLGYMRRPEDPAHVWRGKDVAERIATTIHEDMHRLTHPEVLESAMENPTLKEFYEGVTEYLSQQTLDGLHEFKPGEVYPEQVEMARQITGEVGEQAMRDWFFKNEVSEELSRALDRITG